MKTFVALIIGLAIGAMLGGSYAAGSRAVGYRSAVSYMQREAVKRNCGQWARNDDGSNRFQWIVKMHSSQRDNYPGDVFVSNDEPVLANR